MRTFLKSVFVLVFLAVSTPSNAQDQINKKNGEKIYCKITGEDSVFLFYRRPPQKSKLWIPKSEVENFTIRNGTPQTPALPLKNDSVKKKDLLLLRTNIGAAFPVGQFASKNAESIESGLAKAGISLEGSLVIKLHRMMGLAAYYRYQSNPMDSRPIWQLYANTAPGVKFMVTTTSWKMRGALAGIYFTTPLTKDEKLFLDLEVFLGKPAYTMPSVEVKVLNGPFYTLFQDQAYAQAFTMLGAAQLKYKIDEGLFMNFGFQFLNAKPHFKNISIKESVGNRTYYSTLDQYDQKISTINFQIGLVLAVGR